MGNVNCCTDCGKLLTREDRYFQRSETSVDVETAELESNEQTFCIDCSPASLDSDLPRV